MLEAKAVPLLLWMPKRVVGTSDRKWMYQLCLVSGSALWPLFRSLVRSSQVQHWQQGAGPLPDSIARLSQRNVVPSLLRSLSIS
jgi:hypothetical protein